MSFTSWLCFGAHAVKKHIIAQTQRIDPHFKSHVKGGRDKIRGIFMEAINKINFLCLNDFIKTFTAFVPIQQILRIGVYDAS